ncbi:UDP-galactopyranose mutase [Pararhodobacter sp.]|uniref:UDP-galactopyranose mutase n=1 Tax=Pararhodobacter sp. TaxID=2127056 RepID=UPI003A598794
MRSAEAEALLADVADTSITDPQSFAEQALRDVGRDLYEAFFKGYTEKQWGCSATELPASILKRLPVRVNCNDNNSFHRFQGMPEDGYTPMIAAILDHPGISVALNTPSAPAMAEGVDPVFWSGALGGYFAFAKGRLGYRTQDFGPFRDTGDDQGCAVMNYGDRDAPRLTEARGTRKTCRWD